MKACGSSPVLNVGIGKYSLPCPPATVASELGGEPKTENWYIAQTAPDAQLIVAAGVPASIVGWNALGPGIHDVTIEVDRPDDPVHNLRPFDNIEGHQYDIMFGDSFQGSPRVDLL